MIAASEFIDDRVEHVFAAAGADDDEVGAGGIDFVFNQTVDATSEGENEDDGGDADADAEGGEERASAGAAEGGGGEGEMGAEEEAHDLLAFFLVDFLDVWTLMVIFLVFFSGLGFMTFFSMTVRVGGVGFLGMDLPKRTEMGSDSPARGRSRSATVLMSVSIWPSSMLMTRVA